jgi:hypothetical protein
MADRERIREAIEGPVNEATKLLANSSSADLETRLTMLIDGWGRGLAAGLEELALSLTEIGRTEKDDSPSERSAPRRRAAEERSQQEQLEEPTSQRAEPGEPADEAGLQKRAAASREATAQLRDETTETRGRPDSPA